MMFRNLFSKRGKILWAGEKARRVHSRWLSDAIAHRVPTYKRIPVRKVSEGGFAPVMATTEGREWADGWWEGAFVVCGSDRCR